jgi:glycosyltransferase involved in cell wall biosynthesis
MKIAMTHVDLPNESKGGVAYQAHYLANALSERGHEVTMFTFSPKYPECRYEVHQFVLSPKLKRFHAFFLALKLLKTDFSQFDILHTHGDNYLLWNRCPQVRTFHGSAIDEATSAVRLRRRLYQSVMAGLEWAGTQVADINVGVSQATLERLPAISHIIPCGVDTKRFLTGTKASHPCILFVGTTDGRKRGSWLAEVFTRDVRPQFPDAELWAVTEKPLLGKGIVNFGRVPLDQLCELYQRAWVFCLPSTYEGFGVPYIEALAAGTAVVASPNPGAKEVLDNGMYGVLSPDDGLGTWLNQLLGDASLRNTFAQRGLLRAEEYRWEKVAQRYEALYLELLSRSASADGAITKN